MLRAIIFDFDGVIANSEPVHLAMFQRALGEIGIFLPRDEYIARYLGYDDRACFRAILTDRGHAAGPEEIEDLVRKKALALSERIQDEVVIYPGVRELVRDAAPRCRLAVASGALRQEIESVLESADLKKDFEHITSAEDVRRGKPDPETPLHALQSLNRLSPPGTNPLEPSDCLVIEDSRVGIQAAQAAGMKVLAVATTHRLVELDHADWAVHSLRGLTVSALMDRLWGSP